MKSESSQGKKVRWKGQESDSELEGRTNTKSIGWDLENKSGVGKWGGKVVSKWW